ncbi:hypothetical protein [Niabella hibiscisoli]|uniref:hypothetical protein n=1 Tax=Niabella hibiscisoli TaxID=1825928 RepID=UPI001F10F659|nr:hypothetical protein [Niabella hibiscisoli]MCH5719518.1 hypothetical protein [Niabella hibiscisoli]
MKLTGIRHIDKIIPLHATGGFVREGQILATLFSKEYHIIMHMPVDGYVLKINDSLTGAEVLANTEKEVWIAIITPWDPDHRNQLMQQEDYYRNSEV